MAWVSLWGDLPDGLKRKAIAVAKTIWLAVGNTQVPQLDDWWHKVRMSYIPRPDGSPEAIIMNLIEGEPDHPSASAAYMVDIIRRRVKIKAIHQYADIPEQCMPTIDELEKWVRKMPERREAQRRADEEAARKRAEQERERARKLKIEEEEAFRAYEERLYSSKAWRLYGSDSKSGDEKALGKRKRDEDRAYEFGKCQKCGKALSRCPTCKIASCALTNCTGGGDDGLRACSNHPTTLNCANCRDKAKQWTDVPVAECTACAEWYCSDEILWCTGEVKGDDSRHDPQPIYCLDCASSVLETVHFPCQYHYCSRKTEHYSGRGKFLQSATCWECHYKGRACEEREEHDGSWAFDGWVCSFCVDEAYGECPTCEGHICVQNVAHQCGDCGAFDSCEDCRGSDEDESDISDAEQKSSTPKPPPITFLKPKCRCNLDYLCSTCTKDTEYCYKCQEEYCPSCKATATCVDCGDVEGCSSCIYDKHVCPECDEKHLEEYLEQEYADFEYGGEEWDELYI